MSGSEIDHLRWLYSTQSYAEKNNQLCSIKTQSYFASSKIMAMKAMYLICFGNICNMFFWAFLDHKQTGDVDIIYGLNSI